MKNLKNFLQQEEIHSLSITDRLVATLWWYYHNNKISVRFSQLVEDNIDAGYPTINKSREKRRLKQDKRTISKDKWVSFELNIRAIKELDTNFLNLLDKKLEHTSTTLFSLDDFKSTKNYLYEVVRQANVSYDHHLFDCCAVMIRRLLEALIIELYIKNKKEDEIKNSDGDYKMFSGLLAHINSDAKSLGLGRNTPKHLQHIKELADKSAHAINFNVKKKLLDDKKHDFQLAVAELKQLTFDN